MVTTNDEPVIVLDVGIHNHLSGPDFLNAKVEIDGQLWAGNIEIHLKSSDWYAHHHERNANYNSVILHVVWENDGEVFRNDNSKIPTLELKNYIPNDLLHAYQNLLDKRGTNFINCEKNIAHIDGFLIKNWLERLYFERLEHKSQFVFGLLKTFKNDWERVLFTLLLKNFGLKINGEAFLSLAHAVDFSTVRKLRPDTLQLESVLFGMSRLLEDETIVDKYYMRLKGEYLHQKRKFNLTEDSVQKPEFFKLRPPNFPTIRLSQLANLYAKQQNLFDKVIMVADLKEVYTIFNVSASDYWNTHFTFGKESKKSTKRLTKNFIDLLLINSILPLKFCYAQYKGKDVNEEIVQIISQIKKEENNIVANFKKYGVAVENAKESQGMLQLYTAYCIQNKCLQCAVGNSLLNGNG